MYDQSFCARTLERALRKSDFRGVDTKNQKSAKTARIKEALAYADNCLLSATPLLSSFSLKEKLVFKINNSAHELAIRKACHNLERIVRPQGKGRGQIVSCLNLLLREGVPYKVYRLDVANFYESFKHDDVLSKIHSLARLSYQSKIIISNVLKDHKSIGGTGVPRGLSVSALLSNFMMRDSDYTLTNASGVYFYSRYVDDIIIITSGQENEDQFIKIVQKNLPDGLILNTKKTNISPTINQVKPSDSQPTVLKFEYLGYSYVTREPKQQKGKQPGTHERSLIIDIADSKIKKIKTRIAKSFLDFSNTADWDLLIDRIRFLTQNFAVYNVKAGGKKLAGIFHSYPQVTIGAKGLIELDSFLRHATLSKTGRIFSRSSKLMNGQQKRILLSYSFVGGHKNKTFAHFSAARISAIQKCWKY
jgi:hypothetical protein